MPGNPQRKAALMAAGMWPPPEGMTAAQALESLRAREVAGKRAEAQAVRAEAVAANAGGRHRAQTDLYWLASEVLGYKDLVERVHRPITELFVAKDPERGFYQQSEVKQRLILYPRGSFKSTLDMADAIQWVLCFPDVRILLMSGSNELAVRMVKEIKWHFLANERLLELFPEHRLDERDQGREAEFTTPARKNGRLREPSISVSTIASIKAGSHFEIVKCDDIVDELNSNTPEQLDKVWRAFNYTLPLLEPNGYRDVVGTRYHNDDAYGRILSSGEGDWTVAQAPAWTLRAGAKKDSEAEADYELLFPERLTWNVLRKIQRADAWLFAAQYLNDATERTQQRFPRELLLKHTIPHSQIKIQETRVQFWDIAYSQKAGRDWTVGVTCVIDGRGRMFVVDMVRDRFAPSMIGAAIVDAAARWRPQIIGIEDSLGVKFIQPQLAACARECGVALPVEWVKPPRDSGAKRGRILALESLLVGDKLFFSAALPQLGELHGEFERYPATTHDDICDAVAWAAARYLRPDRVAPVGEFEAQEDFGLMGSAKLSPAYDDVLGAGIPG
jgi:predicted phage terminase large subunit-like protein